MYSNYFFIKNFFLKSTHYYPHLAFNKPAKGWCSNWSTKLSKNNLWQSIKRNKYQTFQWVQPWTMLPLHDTDHFLKKLFYRYNPAYIYVHHNFSFFSSCKRTQHDRSYDHIYKLLYLVSSEFLAQSFDFEYGKSVKIVAAIFAYNGTIDHYSMYKTNEGTLHQNISVISYSMWNIFLKYCMLSTTVFLQKLFTMWSLDLLQLKTLQLKSLRLKS